MSETDINICGVAPTKDILRLRKSNIIELLNIQSCAFNILLENREVWLYVSSPSKDVYMSV